MWIRTGPCSLLVLANSVSFSCDPGVACGAASGRGEVGLPRGRNLLLPAARYKSRRGARRASAGLIGVIPGGNTGHTAGDYTITHNQPAAFLPAHRWAPPFRHQPQHRDIPPQESAKSESNLYSPT